MLEAWVYLWIAQKSFHESLETLCMKDHHGILDPYLTEDNKREIVKPAIKWTSSARYNEKTFDFLR